MNSRHHFLQQISATTKEVDKMQRWGAVVDTNDHNALIDYLSANFGPDQPSYEASRYSPESVTSERCETEETLESAPQAAPCL